MYVYKLNEDIILYKHSSENNQSSSHMMLAHLQHRPGHFSDCTKGRLEKSCGPALPPLIPESSDQKAPIISPFFPFSFLEIGWLYQNEILLLDPVLQMIII